jgi:hypothetical protein
MRTIALVSQTTGSGRTSLALALSLAAVRARVSVRAADFDPARDLSGRLRDRFGDPDAPFDVLKLPLGLSFFMPGLENFERAVLAIHDQDATDLLIMDTADGLGASVEAVLSISDLALVPVRGDHLALRAAQATATRMLGLRTDFAFVAVGENAARAVPALKAIGLVAGTLSDPSSEEEADALLANLRKMLVERPSRPAGEICRDRIARREARRNESDRASKGLKAPPCPNVDLTVLPGRDGQSRLGSPRRVVSRHQETIAAR